MRYKETNRLRNPYRDIERYILPVAVTGGFWLIATLLDLWCTSDQCEVSIRELYYTILCIHTCIPCFYIAYICLQYDVRILLHLYICVKKLYHILNRCITDPSVGSVV